jgi:hypothetical protein
MRPSRRINARVAVSVPVNRPLSQQVRPVAPDHAADLVGLASERTHSNVRVEHQMTLRSNSGGALAELMRPRFNRFATLEAPHDDESAACKHPAVRVGAFSATASRPARAADRMMASRAWCGQMTNEPATSGRDNLFGPVDGDCAAQRRFTSASKRSAISISASVTRAMTAAADIGLVALWGTLARKRIRRTRQG